MLISLKKASKEPPENLWPRPARDWPETRPRADGSDKSAFWATKKGRKKPFAKRIRELKKRYILKKFWKWRNSRMRLAKGFFLPVLVAQNADLSLPSALGPVSGRSRAEVLRRFFGSFFQRNKHFLGFFSIISHRDQPSPTATITISHHHHQPPPSLATNTNHHHQPPEPASLLT